MLIRDHGAWEYYKPEAPTAQSKMIYNVLYARRVGDNVDWYAYVRSGTNFVPENIKMTVRSNVVAAAVFDPEMLFPADSTILEVSGVTTDDPQTMFGGKIYDPSTQTFNDPPVPERQPSIPELLKRIEALEAKGHK